MTHERYMSWIQAFEFGISVGEALSGSEFDIQEMRSLVKDVADNKRDFGNKTFGFPDSTAAGMVLESYAKIRQEYKEMLESRIRNCGRESVDPVLLEKHGL